MLMCSDNTLYTGVTNNLEKRVLTHNKGRGAKYTKARLPVSLVCFWNMEDKVSAYKREYQIKQLSRMEKLKLIESKLFD